MTRQLAALYAERPAAVTEALFSDGASRLRDLADAFRFRKE
jgi:hypothetical protein